MPVRNKNLDVNARISVFAHHLKHSEAPELLKRRADFNIPRLRFTEKIARRVERDDRKIMFDIALDDLPDRSFSCLVLL
jgi:predicted enzyme involved in methoxymalonyl-ACP biosynthesis